ncbi:unnamed protein product [Protopolystoma xenopodis]|uniref:Uncharacterized protein n=1 Tax=Protopolystoma xenopodis TaxID=117903 RepID=A0A3S5B299_9PLAT|nr:unnamed protein product [Protopolystoma xenopodis]
MQSGPSHNSALPTDQLQLPILPTAPMPHSGHLPHSPFVPCPLANSPFDQSSQNRRLAGRFAHSHLPNSSCPPFPHSVLMGLLPRALCSAVVHPFFPVSYLSHGMTKYVSGGIRESMLGCNSTSPAQAGQPWHRRHQRTLAKKVAFTLA